MTTLTPKQEAFAQAYMQTGSASEAYRTAYDASKMKRETVHRAAQEMIDHPKVSTRISELQQAAKQRHQLTVDDLINELEEARKNRNGWRTPNTCGNGGSDNGQGQTVGL